MKKGYLPHYRKKIKFINGLFGKPGDRFRLLQLPIKKNLIINNNIVF